jgi:hypothetical protein
MRQMKNILTKQIGLTGISCPQQTQNKNPLFKIHSCQCKAAGSSMIELLIATFLALIAASSAAQIMNKLYDSGLNRRAAATSAIEVAISNDLAWFRQYAVLWQLETGPYEQLDGKVTQTNYTKGPNIKYKAHTGCNAPAIANDFRKDAASLDQNFDAIKKPSPDVPNGASWTEFEDLPKSAPGYTLERKIESDNLPGILTITYKLSKSNNTLFERTNSLYLPAAGWCP